MGLAVSRGGVNPGSHKDDWSYRHYLLAEMSNGRIHELGWWTHEDDAWAARRELMERIGEAKELTLRVDSEATPESLPDLCSASVHWEIELRLEEAADSLKAIVNLLDK